MITVIIGIVSWIIAVLVVFWLVNRKPKVDHKALRDQHIKELEIELGLHEPDPSVSEILEEPAPPMWVDYRIETYMKR